MLLFQQTFIAKRGSKSSYTFEIYVDDETNEVVYHQYKLYDNGELVSGSIYNNVEDMKEEIMDFYSRPEDFDKVYNFEGKFRFTDIGNNIVAIEDLAKEAGE